MPPPPSPLPDDPPTGVTVAMNQAEAFCFASGGKAKVVQTLAHPVRDSSKESASRASTPVVRCTPPTQRTPSKRRTHAHFHEGPALVQDAPATSRRSPCEFLDEPLPSLSPSFSPSPASASSSAHVRHCGEAAELAAGLESHVVSSLGGRRLIQACIAADIDRWRQAFHEEAEKCVQSMREVVSETTNMKFASLFAQWRNEQQQIMTHLLDRLEELTGHNRHLQHVLDTNRFNEMVAGLKEKVDVIVADRDQCEKDLSRVAEFAARKSFAVYEADVRAMTQQHCAHFEAELHRWSENTDRWRRSDEQWAELGGRLDQMQERVGHIDEMTSAYNVSPEVKVFPQELDEVVQKVASAVLSAADDVKGTAHDVAATLRDDVRRGTAEEGVAIRDHTDAVIARVVGTSEAVKRPIGEVMESTEEWLRALHPIQEQADHWRRVADSSRAKAEDAVGKCEQLAADIAHARQESDGLGKEVTTLRQEVQETRCTLASSRATMAGDAFRVIKQVELQGNVKLNVQSGEVELLRPVEFVPPGTASPPLAEFKNPGVAALALDDIPKIANMFSVPLCIECRVVMAKTGSAQFWEELASSRAELVRSYLEGQGVPRELMTTKGLPGKKSPSHTPGIAIRFSADDIFPTMHTQVEEKAQKGSPRGRSPRKQSPRA